MKAISIWQPWASAIAAGLKKYETRSWATRYRGPVAIHATKSQPAYLQRTHALLFQELGEEFLPQGCIVAVASLDDCLSTNLESWMKRLSARERRWGFFDPDRYAWKLSGVVRLENPVPCAGAQGLWTVPVGVVRKVRAETLAGAILSAMDSTEAQ